MWPPAALELPTRKARQNILNAANPERVGAR
ncbi:hypothetical protein Pan241w_47700 [Gimesia alba]|uniref:Uncharacterized protein n=1 Tax=Gimesia alba TaxID=2527973 RepID=A0A517RL91_9PLAN|nr:hypothetical protein Pan241w_47700 [Gimesia alba]